MAAMARPKVIRFPGSRPPASAPAGDGNSLVEVRRCRNQAEALVVRALLDSEGIPTALRSRLAHSVYPFSVGGQAETIVLVPAADVLHARRILAVRSIRALSSRRPDTGPVR